MSPPFRYAITAIVLAVVFAASVAKAAVRETIVYAVYRGSAVVERPATEALCKSRAIELEEIAGPDATYKCNVSYTYVRTTVTPPPPAPVDCVVSWSQPEPAICPASGQQTRTATIVTPAANGGTACPALTEPVPCTYVPPASAWTHCAEEHATCTFTDTHVVRYGGAPGAGNGPTSNVLPTNPDDYFEQTHTDSVLCSNDVFGDPVDETYKDCWVQAEVITTPPPPPPPPPVPPDPPENLTNAVSWNAPTFQDWSATKILWGPSASQMTQWIDVPAPAVSYSLTGLAPGTYYIRAQFLTSTGAESALSAAVTKVVNGPQAGNWPQPPMPGMPVITQGGNVTYEPGNSGLLIGRAGSVQPTDDIGAFRISCRPSHTNFDDPLIFPGDVGRSHNHSFFGGVNVNANTNIANIRSSVTHSTCAGGSANKSGYWTPSMLNAQGQVVKPASIQVYYKSGYSPWRHFSAINPLPPGLRMLAGNPMDTGAAGNYKHKFSCDYEGSPALAPAQTGVTIPACPGDNKPNIYQNGATLWGTLDFPNCWDGQNLDSANHRSHMAYGMASGCPASHPVLISTITFNVIWKVEAGQNTNSWKLSDTMGGSSPGYSFHGDWVNGWDPAIEAKWLANCVKASVDCHSNNLGNGESLELP